MYETAYRQECIAAEKRHIAGIIPAPRPTLTLLALALGTFAIGSGEFGSNGIIQLFSSNLHTSVANATWAITAYAGGVMIGSPAITLLAARLNRRTLLLGLIGLFLAGNILSALAPSLALLIVFRFSTGTVQGAYFGAGAVVAGYVYGPGRGGKAFATVMTGLTIATLLGSPFCTFIGQHAGWRATYWTVTALGILAGAALLAWLPCTDNLRGNPITSELSALRNRGVWLMVAVAALGISSIFAVYTFIGPFITDATHKNATLIPIALAVFGAGMAVGNHLGGRVADHYESRGLVYGFTAVLVVLATIGLAGQHITVLFPALFATGATTMFTIPTIQVRLTNFAPTAPTLMGALNLAALNLANSLGATGGSLALHAGWGTLSTVWIGFLLTATGLTLYGAAVPRSAKPTAAIPKPSGSPA